MSAPEWALLWVCGVLLLALVESIRLRKRARDAEYCGDAWRRYSDLLRREMIDLGHKPPKPWWER
jgi:hypothetical protein